MSYPSPNWQISGGENFRSRGRKSTNPRAAMKEWLTLCDAITRSGGRILVMPPAEGATGMVYTANAGALFKAGEHYQFMISNMAVAHRKGEREHIKKFLTEAGVPCSEATATWEGQADICTLPSNRFILSYGVRSTQKSLDEVRPRLPQGARVLDVELVEPYFHGDTCLNSLHTRGGDSVLLVYGGAMKSRTPPELRTFLGNLGEVLTIEEEDALNYACNALCLDGTLLAPPGLSTSLRGNLARRRHEVVEIELPELFGKGGGGPRCLVNELRGLVLTDEAPNYTMKRDQLHALAETYPESITA